MSDTLPGTTLPDDNNDRTWWGLPCTVTPCFGARLVQEGNRLHYLADRACIRGRFSDADSYHLDQAFPLLMKQVPFFISAYQENLHYENITRHACTGGIVLPVSRHHLADTAHPVTGPALRPRAE
ncbi:antitoxin [Escherichia coli]|nr:antitoxin [Escherichia coli]